MFNFPRVLAVIESPFVAIGAAVIAVAVVSTTSYISGKNSVTIEWAKADKRVAAEALAQSETFRIAERTLQLKITGLTNAYQNQKISAARAASGANVRLRQLNDYLDAANHAVPGADPSATIRNDDAARARFVVGQCSKALVELAQSADAGEAKLAGLQAYVTDILEAQK